MISNTHTGSTGAEQNAFLPVENYAFKKVIIANRGEIAVRIIKTAKKLGLRTVAVYSAADAETLHVKMADESVMIGDARPAESYLCIDAIARAARLTGAEAVHPGYGFLSENAEFAQKCRESGLVFIGPDADVIRLMGNKAEAKRYMQEAGVPCIPGYTGIEQDDQSLADAAEEIGYPLMIKAAAGGGGRGMRLVNCSDEFIPSLHSARSEAKNAFNSDEIILEKAIKNARHVEVQIMADKQGNVVHLAERDCSMQRRNQKVIEESPCPILNQDLRDAMGRAAVKAAQSVSYHNAGTVEFILDEQKNFYFMEMNTRLQVEHPVTEMVTGLDLVELQFRIACGEPLPFQQDDVVLQGHAIEVRLYAEDPDNGFIPQVGDISVWQPVEQEGVRVDHGLSASDHVSPYYDPMLAKFICYGDTREVALQRLGLALRNSLCLGLRTNQYFLHQLVSHDAFVCGDYTTDYIANNPTQMSGKPPVTMLVMAAVLLFRRDSDSSYPAYLHNWRSTGWSESALTLKWREKEFGLRVKSIGEVFSVGYLEDKFSVKLIDEGSGVIICVVDSIRHRVSFASRDNQYFLHWDGLTECFEDCTYSDHSLQQGEVENIIRSPINGRVLAMDVNAGTVVKKSQTLFTIESMKMEYQVSAPLDGVIGDLAVAVDHQVSVGSILAEIVPESEE